MKTHRNYSTLTKVLIGLFSAAFFFSCSSEDDPDYVWLATVAPGLAGTEGSSSGEVQEIPFTMDVEDVDGSSEFLWDTMASIPINVTVLDAVQPVDGSLVQVIARYSVNEGDVVIFNATTNEEGQVSGTITYDRASPVVTIQVSNGSTFADFEVDLTAVQVINRRVRFNADLTVTPYVPVSDRDGDGVPDEDDMYPDDALRATMVKYPAEGYYTIAYEDLYPRRGDADFNDYVVRASFEEDLNAEGKVVRIRAKYTHVAKGAGYNHTLQFAVKGADPASGYSLRRFDELGAPVSTDSGSLTGSVEVLGNSSQTISSQNSKASQTFQIGHSVEIELALATPLNRTQAVAPPYDTFIHVITTGHDIHLPGRYFNEDGTDKYIDNLGFPWGLVVGGDFAWPYERQDIHDAYTGFQPWYESGGVNNADWYKTPTDGLVYIVP